MPSSYKKWSLSQQITAPYRYGNRKYRGQNFKYSPMYATAARAAQAAIANLMRRRQAINIVSKYVRARKRGYKYRKTKKNAI